MSEKLVNAPVKGQAALGVVLIAGRIEASHRHEGQTFTRLICPAADAYEGPSHRELRSTQRLGDVGDDVRVECRIGGYRGKEQRLVDEKTGEIRKFIPVRNTLVVIE